MATSSGSAWISAFIFVEVTSLAVTELGVRRWEEDDFCESQYCLLWLTVSSLMLSDVGPSIFCRKKVAIVNAAAGVSYLTNLLCQPENWSDALRGASFRKIGVYPGAQLQKLRKFNRSATPNSILERNLKRSLEKSEHSVRTQLKNSKEIFENS